MAKLGTILETQFKKLKIDISEDAIKAVLAAAVDIEVPDDIASQIDKGLLTVDAAKVNTEVTKALKASTLAGIDAKIDEIIKESGVTVDQAFAEEKNSYEKVVMLSKVLVEHGKKKGEGLGKDGAAETLKKEREAWVAKEADWQAKLKKAGEDIAALDTTTKETRKKDLTDFSLQKKLLTKDYVFPKDMDSDLKVQTAEGAIKKDLASKGLFMGLNDAGVLVITDKDGNKAYNEKHEAIESADSYFDAVLTHNKLLNINDPNAQPNPEGSPGGAQTISNPQNQGNQQIVAEIDAMLFK